MFEIKRDGKLLHTTATEQEAWRWMHNHQPASIHHATTAEGYSITEARPNCYECRHRGSVPGNSHSSCQHPIIAKFTNDPLAQVVGLLGKRGMRMNVDKIPGMNVKGDQHGKDKGWFNWPVCFDPAWLTRCDAFEAKAEKVALDA